jgi:hypothetical protein
MNRLWFHKTYADPVTVPWKRVQIIISCYIQINCPENEHWISNIESYLLTKIQPFMGKFLNIFGINILLRGEMRNHSFLTFQLEAQITGS